MSEEIYFSPATQIFESKPPGTLVCGVPGSGKTYCLDTMVANCIEQGMKAFCLDAKNDMLALQNLFPDIKIIDVNKIAPGSLDPFLVFKKIDAATVLTVTEVICGKLNERQKLDITPIINDFIKLAHRNGTTFREFANYLYSNQSLNAQEIGNSLLMQADTKYGKLVFGEACRKSRGMKLSNKNMIISIFGMQLPSGSSTPKPDELISSAVVYIICKMMKEILSREASKTPHVVVFDECHMLMRSEAITDVIDELLVLGRSLNIPVILASQNVTHFTESIAQLVGTKIAFKMSKKEAKEFFDAFDNTTSSNALDVEECIETMTRLKTGYCFMIDRKERCSLIHVTSSFNHDDLTSNPLLKKRRK